MFNYMPVAAIVEEKIFCIHGGLSPDLTLIEEVKDILRPTDISDTGVICDLLWSDPEEDFTGWGDNERGVSYIFGSNILLEFNKRNKIDLVIRGHQVVEDGYEFFANRSLVTIFSAPNYCGEFDNKGAVLVIDKDLVCSFQIYEGNNLKTVSLNYQLTEEQKKNERNKSLKYKKKKRPKTPPKIKYI